MLLLSIAFLGSTFSQTALFLTPAVAQLKVRAATIHLVRTLPGHLMRQGDQADSFATERSQESQQTRTHSACSIDDQWKTDTEQHQMTSVHGPSGWNQLVVIRQKLLIGKSGPTRVDWPSPQDLLKVGPCQGEQRATKGGLPAE
jgi:hypothetical protein